MFFLLFHVQLFASLAPFALGVLDQDLSSTTRMAQPQLYRFSQQNGAFNTKVCLGVQYVVCVCGALPCIALTIIAQRVMYIQSLLFSLFYRCSGNGCL